MITVKMTFNNETKFSIGYKFRTLFGISIILTNPNELPEKIIKQKALSNINVDNRFSLCR